MSGSEQLDVAIVGGGPGGVIALHYARKAGLKTVLLEKQDTIGGLWARLPSWQDIQNRPEDWTLGDIPIAGVDQVSIAANIRHWVHRFGLAEHIRLNCPVISATPIDGDWQIRTATGNFRAKALSRRRACTIARLSLKFVAAAPRCLSFILQRFTDRTLSRTRPLLS